MSVSSTSSVVLTGRRDAGAGLRLVTLTPPLEIAQAYRAPGQYIEVRAPSGAGYFVLAGEIGAPSWEVLVRSNGDASDALTSSPEGTVFELNGPLGKGFPLEDAHARPLIVAVAGSALAVTRPILRDRVARRQGAATSVYIGARTAKDVALADEVAGWAHAGARVVLCLSRPDATSLHLHLDAEKRSGWVQQVLAADISEGRVRSGVVFAAGPAGMLEAVRSLSKTAPTLEVVTNV